MEKKIQTDEHNEPLLAQQVGSSELIGTSWPDDEEELTEEALESVAGGQWWGYGGYGGWGGYGGDGYSYYGGYY
jgi:hypothetical protein